MWGDPTLSGFPTSSVQPGPGLYRGPAELDLADPEAKSSPLALLQKQQQFFSFLFITVVLCVVVFILHQSLSNF